MLSPVKTWRHGEMKVSIYESSEAVGEAAAEDLEKIVKADVVERNRTAIIMATGNSQLWFMRSLRATSGMPWQQVTILHMDEFLGMPDQHPASFRRFIREHLTDFVHPWAFHGIAGEAADVGAEMARYAALLRQHEPVACIMGIGENGHLAFNDPPADFAAEELIQVVTLAEASRQQQVGEGHFATLNDVPRQALSLTIPALLSPPHVLVVVPEARKAQAVKNALQGPVTGDCPASILRTSPRVKLYLDPDSAALLEI